jgi:hypothetical protein
MNHDLVFRQNYQDGQKEKMGWFFDRMIGKTGLLKVSLSGTVSVAAVYDRWVGVFFEAVGCCKP